MKIFISGPAEHHRYVSDVIRHLEKAGFRVTHDWTVNYEEDLRTVNRLGPEGERTRKRIARECIEGVRKAQAMVIIHKKRAKLQIWYGTSVEYGAACLKGIPVVMLLDDLEAVKTLRKHPSLAYEPAHMAGTTELATLVEHLKEIESELGWGGWWRRILGWNGSRP